MMEYNITDQELLRELKAYPALLAEVQGKVLARKLHNQIYELINKAVSNDDIKIESVDDFITLVELDLLLISKEVQK